MNLTGRCRFFEELHHRNVTFLRIVLLHACKVQNAQYFNCLMQQIFIACVKYISCLYINFPLHFLFQVSIFIKHACISPSVQNVALWLLIQYNTDTIPMRIILFFDKYLHLIPFVQEKSKDKSHAISTLQFI